MSTENPTNRKAGKVLGTDGAPGLPVAGRVFGESPVRKPNEPTRADAGEERNLKEASSPAARTE